MTKNGYGRIINVASVHGLVSTSSSLLFVELNTPFLFDSLVASANKSAYVAAKHGIIGLTKTVALETAGTGVTCVAICPGWVRTPLVEAQIKARAEKSGLSFDEEAKLLISEKMPSGTFVEVEHLAQTVHFLCSDAASQITGQAIVMDGGWVAQ